MMILLAVILSTQDSSAFLDSAAARLVAAARERRQREERLVTWYSATVTQRIGVGIRALRRDRMLYRSEMVARIEWRRDSTSRIEIVGARHAVPVAMPGVRVPDDLDNWAAFLAFDPAQDYLRLVGQDREGFVYPLAEGAEAHYRYRSGDTVSLALPDGRSIRLLELRVSPRRAEFRLMSGSLWLDEASLGVVRAVFRPARPFDFELDADEGDEDDVPAMLKPIRAEVRYVTIEYGLFGGRWWLPRFVALDAEASAGSFLKTPMRFERVYTDVRARGGSEPARGDRRRGAFRVVGGDPSFDEHSPDSLRALIAECVEESRRQQEERRRQDEAGVRVEVRVGRQRECWQRRRGRPDLEVAVSGDTASLLSSPSLGPPILDLGDVVSERELRELAREIGALPDRPWQSRWGVEFGPASALRHARFNRVEGLSLGARFALDLGKAEIDLTGRLGAADLVPNVEAGVRRRGFLADWRLSGYHRLAAADPSTSPFGVINSAAGLLFGRDDGEYFRASGADLTLRPGATRPARFSFRLYAERQRPESVRTSASLPRLFDSGQRFRGNFTADSADQVGATVGLRAALLTRSAMAAAAEAVVEGSAGSFDFARASVTARASAVVSSRFAAALEGSAGTSAGAVPAQGRFFLGGPATLRGYTGAAAVGTAFWRARAELANSLPAVRLALFADAGWAGDRAAFGGRRPLVAVGTGVSLMDGLLRVDLAKGLRAPGGWRLDFSVDGVL